MFPKAAAVIVQPARAWEEVASVFMERNSHDAIGLPKGQFDTVPMVNIYVNIENPWMVSAIE